MHETRAPQVMYLVLTPAVPPGASSYLRLGCQWYRNDPLGYVIDRRLCDGRRKGSLFGYDDLSLPVHSIHAISHSPDRCAAKGVSLLHPSAGRAGRHVFSDRARDAHNDADEHELPAAVYQMAGQFSVDPCVLRSTFGGLRSFSSHSLPFMHSPATGIARVHPMPPRAGTCRSQKEQLSEMFLLQRVARRGDWAQRLGGMSGVQSNLLSLVSEERKHDREEDGVRDDVFVRRSEQGPLRAGRHRRRRRAR